MLVPLVLIRICYYVPTVMKGKYEYELGAMDHHLKLTYECKEPFYNKQSTIKDIENEIRCLKRTNRILKIFL